MSSTFDRLLSFYESAVFDPLTIASLAITAVSTGIGAAGTIASGENAVAMGKYQQAEYQQQGETAEATGQRAMLEERRKTGLVQSTLQARAAGSGGSATAPSTLNLSGQIAKRGEYNALMDLSQGQNQQLGLEGQGDTAAYGGKIAQIGDTYSSIGTVAGGAGSFARTLQYGSGNLPQYASYNPLAP